MKKRADLHAILVNILGSQNVYFQPPENVKLKFPCIIYERSKIATKFADNMHYKMDNAYSVMFIYKDPDSTIVDEIAKLPMCKLDRFYTAENLYHAVYTIYY